MILTFLALMALLICIIAAIADVMIMKIPNILVLALLCLYSQYAIASTVIDQTSIVLNLITAVFLFIVTSILFFTRIIGGGDAKLISVLGLWIGLEGLPIFLLGMSVSGLVLGLAAYALRPALRRQSIYDQIPSYLRKENSWVNNLHKNKNCMPYGIAIATGATLSFYFNGMLAIPL